MPDKLVIRTTDRSDFKQCRARWNFRSKIRGNWIPLKPADYLEYGTAWHEAMRAWYYPENWAKRNNYRAHELAARDAFVQTTRQQKKALIELGFDGPDLDEEFDARLKLGDGMLSYYFGWSRVNDDFEPVTVEHEFEVQIGWVKYSELNRPVIHLYNPYEVNTYGFVEGPDGTVPIMYQGRIDGLVRDFAGNYLLLEHKTAEREQGTFWLQMDSQVGSYIWVFQHALKVPIKGCIYTKSYKRVPHKPAMLKSDASVSCNKKQLTTAALFVEAVEEAHPFRPAHETISEDEKYFNYHQFLTSEHAPKFIERHIVTRNPRQIENIGRWIALEAREMLDDPEIYPNVSPINCNKCAFRGPCMTWQEGGDVEFHLASEFMQRND